MRIHVLQNAGLMKLIVFSSCVNLACAKLRINRNLGGKMTIHSVIMAVTLLLCTSLYAASLDERIEFAAHNSYTFKTLLKDDAVQIVSKDGVVTLTGTVKEEQHKSLAQQTVSVLPGVVRVENQIEVKAKE
jgi:hypothetical protein